MYYNVLCMDATSYEIATLEMVKSLVRQTPLKRKIVLLVAKKEGMTISELQEELTKRGDKYNYRTVWQHVLTLQGLSVLLTKKDDHKAGKPVEVFLSTIHRKNKDKLRKKLLEDYPHYQIPAEEKKKYG